MLSSSIRKYNLYFLTILLLFILKRVNSKPNIILILTDDQDYILNGLAPMKVTKRILGFSFINAFTTTPVCCPSRATILSGLYAHNHATINNTIEGGCYSNSWKNNIEPYAIPVKLQSEGYKTFFAGKYLNEYYSKDIPPGWDNFYGLHGNSKYFNYTLTENGATIHYKDKYLTDVLSNKVEDFIKEQNANDPFFAMVSTPAPHAPYTPALRHKNAFKDVKAPRTPNFNLKSSQKKKHWLVSSSKQLNQEEIDKIDLFYKNRWRSLLAVDELVQNIFNALESIQVLNNTYIVFTSDNGYHMGQFTQPIDKRQPYETDIRVPFLLRGPNVPEKSFSTEPIALIDLYPTFMEWAEIQTPIENLDGISFNNYISENSLNTKYQSERQLLIEYWGEGNSKTYNPKCPWKKSDNLAECMVEMGCHCQDSRNNTYACIRHFAYKTDMLYCEFKDKENTLEAYDLNTDNYQIENLVYQLLPSQQALYHLALGNLTKCVGKTCRDAQL